MALTCVDVLVRLFAPAVDRHVQEQEGRLAIVTHVAQCDQPVKGDADRDETLLIPAANALVYIGRYEVL